MPEDRLYLFCKTKLALRVVKPNRLRGDGQSSSLPERIIRLRLASLLEFSLFESRKYRHPRGNKARNKGKRNEFVIMDDALTLVLIIVLCLLFKPLIAAILRGLGSSEHRRDR